MEHNQTYSHQIYLANDSTISQFTTSQFDSMSVIEINL